MTDLVEFHLLGVPIPLHERAFAHMEELQREFALIQQAEPDDEFVPARLRQVIQDLEDRFGGLGDEPSAVLRSAADRDLEEVDVVYQLPIEAGEASSELLVLLRDADAYCQAGELLTLATPPDELAYREWFLGEFIRQARGEPPQSWGAFRSSDTVPEPAPVDLRDALRVHTDAASTDADDEAEGWVVERAGRSARVGFSGDLDLATAPRLREFVSALRGDGVEHLEIDLTAVEFLDSVGLSVLLSTHRRLASEGATMLVRGSAPVQRVFELAGVADLLGS